MTRSTLVACLCAASSAVLHADHRRVKRRRVPHDTASRGHARGVGCRLATPIDLPVGHQPGRHRRVRPESADVLVPRRAERACRSPRPDRRGQSLRSRGGPGQVGRPGYGDIHLGDRAGGSASMSSTSSCRPPGATASSSRRRSAAARPRSSAPSRTSSRHRASFGSATRRPPPTRRPSPTSAVTCPRSQAIRSRSPRSTKRRSRRPSQPRSRSWWHSPRRSSARVSNAARRWID